MVENWEGEIKAIVHWVRLVLYTADQITTPALHMVLLVTLGVTCECRAISNSWAMMGVAILSQVNIKIRNWEEGKQQET